MRRLEQLTCRCGSPTSPWSCWRDDCRGAYLIEHPLPSARNVVSMLWGMCEKIWLLGLESDIRLARFFYSSFRTISCPIGTESGPSARYRTSDRHWFARKSCILIGQPWTMLCRGTSCQQWAMYSVTRLKAANITFWFAGYHGRRWNAVLKNGALRCLTVLGDVAQPEAWRDPDQPRRASPVQIQPP